MATYTWADLHIPQATMLADLSGISLDLQCARELAELLLVERAAEKPNWKLVEPFSIAITVMYSRPFQKGVRHRLGITDLAILTADQRATHDYLWAYRNKHVAHSVNAFEENVSRANYCLERVKEEGITSISYGGARITGLSVNDLKNVVELSTVFGAHVDALIAKEAERLLVIVRKIPLEEVLAGGRKAFVVDTQAAVSKDRKK